MEGKTDIFEQSAPIKTTENEMKLIPLKALSMIFTAILLACLMIGFIDVSSATTEQAFLISKAFYITIFIVILGSIFGGLAEIFAIIGLVVSCVKRDRCLVSTKLFFIVLIILPLFIETGFILITHFLSAPVV